MISTTFIYYFQYKKAPDIRQGLFITLTPTATRNKAVTSS